MSIDTYAQLDRQFQGYARVKLENIDFDSGRDLDDQNVNRLVGIFKLQGCNWESTANAISVLVDRGALGTVLTQQSSLSSAVHSIIPARLPYLNTKVLSVVPSGLHHAFRVAVSYLIIFFFHIVSYLIIISNSSMARSKKAKTAPRRLTNYQFEEERIQSVLQYMLEEQQSYGPQHVIKVSEYARDNQVDYQRLNRR